MVFSHCLNIPYTQLNLIIRQSNKEALKEEAILEEKRELQFTIQELALNLERQDAQIRHLSRIVAELGNVYERLLFHNFKSISKFLLSLGWIF